MNRTLNLFAVSLFALGLTASAIAQSSDEKAAEPNPAKHPSSEPRPDFSRFVMKTYFLSNVTEQDKANEILIAMRNMMDHYDRMYLVETDRAIVVEAPPDQQALAQKIVADLDRPDKIYRLTFTLADSDNGKRVGVQHFSMVVAAGQRTVLKQGDKIPVATGTYDAKNDTGMQTQFQYLDVGLAFDATLIDSPEGLLLKSKVEQSSLGQPTTISGVTEPVIRQTDLEGTSGMKPGKPITLGSLDIEGTTRHIDIEVVADPIS